MARVIGDLKMLKFGQFENASFQMYFLEQTIETLLGFLYLKCPFRAHFDLFATQGVALGYVEMPLWGMGHDSP